MAAIYPPLNEPPLEGDVLQPSARGIGKPARPRFAKAWQQFFSALQVALTAVQAAFGSGPFVVTAPIAGLPNAEVLTATDTVTVDTATANQVKLHVPDHAITYVRMQVVSAAARLLGRGDSGPGTVQEISLGSGLAMVGTVLTLTGAGPTLVPLTTGEEPPVLVSDGAGSIIYVTFTP